MKVPDKIYLWENLMVNGGYDPAWHKNSFNESDVCYIRKDLLLEWAKERLAHYRKLHLENDAFTDMGKCEAFEEIIVKLYSL